MPALPCPVAVPGRVLHKTRLHRCPLPTHGQLCRGFIGEVGFLCLAGAATCGVVRQHPRNSFPFGKKPTNGPGLRHSGSSSASAALIVPGSAPSALDVPVTRSKNAVIVINLGAAALTKQRTTSSKRAAVVFCLAPRAAATGEGFIGTASAYKISAFSFLLSPKLRLYFRSPHHLLSPPT